MVEECGYIKTDGIKCGSPALRGKSHCFYHDPDRASVRRAARPRFFLELPLLEHPGVVQAAVREIYQVLADAKAYFRPAMRLLYALECATRKKGQTPWGAKSARSALRPSIRIARIPGLGRVYSTVNVKKSTQPLPGEDIAPNSNAERQIIDPPK